MNASMCFDLYLSFKNPFYPGYRRMKWYITFTILILILCAYTQKSFLMTPDEDFKMFVSGFISILTKENEDNHEKDSL
jgi:hypothetical protein